MATAARTVLVVEDHAPPGSVRSRLLQRAGFEVEDTGSAAKALERAPYAVLVLLVMRLPENAFNLCKQLKAACPQLPVLMLTSTYHTAQARRDAFAAGADAFLLDPIEPDRLVRMVDGFVSGRLKPDAERTDPPWILTDPVGHIIDLTDSAAKLLNLSRRGAKGRSLPTFFVEDRPRLLSELLRASEGIIINRDGTLQPRDRRPLRVHIDVCALPPAPGIGVQLRWDLERADHSTN